MKILSTGNGLV